MTLEEAIEEMKKFVKLKTTMEPVFVSVIEKEFEKLNDDRK